MYLVNKIRPFLTQILRSCFANEMFIFYIVHRLITKYLELIFFLNKYEKITKENNKCRTQHYQSLVCKYI